MPTRCAINGFGRTGRAAFRAAYERELDIEWAAINDVAEPSMLAHLLKYDTVYGPFPGTVEAVEGAILVDGARIETPTIADPASLPWQELGVEVVVESTGRFRSGADAAKHLAAGAAKVIVSAPAKEPDVTVALGINFEEAYDPELHDVISNASCTTNCLAPLAKVVHENFGIESGLMTTVHSYTNDQKLLDLPHSDMRRARAATLSMIPTSTGAAKAIGLVLPELKGKLDGIAIRVPTPDVSLVDLTVRTAKPATAESVNAALKAAADGPLKGILQYTDEELVSADFLHNPHSSIVDGPLTKSLGDRMVKVFSWYDNEWGFSVRLRDLIKLTMK
jgi:glyceraldehyde 3-phosphate dehydrogenase